MGEVGAVGVLEPLAAKILLLNALLSTLGQLLRLGGVVRVRKGVALRRRRVCNVVGRAARESESDVSASSSSSEDGEADV